MVVILATDPPPGPVALAYQTLDEGNQSGIDADGTTTRVLNDTTSWTAFWDAHKANQFPPPQRPSVDFATHFVVAVLNGPHPTSDFTMEVLQVRWDDISYTVYHRLTPPCEGCATLQVVTTPFHVVLVPRMGDGEPAVSFVAV